jgi:hypothetical protein
VTEVLHADPGLKIGVTAYPKFRDRDPIYFPVIRMIKAITICLFLIYLLNLTPFNNFPFNNRALRGKTSPQPYGLRL